jgi:hypothetical protein
MSCLGEIFTKGIGTNAYLGVHLVFVSFTGCLVIYMEVVDINLKFGKRQAGFGRCIFRS